jgi:hypothetical protein
MGGIVSSKPSKPLNQKILKIIPTSSTLDSKEIDIIKKSVPGGLIQEDDSTNDFKIFCDICKVLTYKEEDVNFENNESSQILLIPPNTSFLIVVSGELFIHFTSIKKKINLLGANYKQGDFIHFFINDLISEKGEIQGENDVNLTFSVKSVGNKKPIIIGASSYDLNNYRRNRSHLVSFNSLFSIDIRDFTHNKEFRDLTADQVF